MPSDRMRRRGALPLLLAIVALSALLASCESPNILGMPPTHTGSPLPGDTFFYRWTAGKTILVYVDTTDAPTGFDLRAATREAGARWNNLTQFADFHVALTDDPARADVVYRFRFAPPIVDLQGCEPAGGGSGRTAFCTDSNPAPVLPLLATGGGHVKVEVYIDPEAASDAQLQLFGLTRQEHFQALVTHEMGHVLGIGSHSGSLEDVMNGAPRVVDPSDQDATVLRWVWLQIPDLLLD